MNKLLNTTQAYEEESGNMKLWSRNRRNYPDVTQKCLIVWEEEHTQVHINSISTHLACHYINLFSLSIAIKKQKTKKKS